MAVRPKPIPEMIGVVRESAHVRRSHVQAMAFVFGRISKPAADLLARFDQGQTNGVASAFQEVRGHQRAARAASDDSDRAGIGRSRWRERSEHRAQIPLIVRSDLTNVY